MTMTAKPETELEQTKWGFYQVKNKPSEEELSSYYADKYYQNGLGSYKVNYSTEELHHKTFINKLIAHKAVDLNKNFKTFCDIGCGEGFLVNEFWKLGANVFSCDFADSIKNFFPKLLQYHKQGNIYEIINLEFKNKKFDIISILNVLEHVIDPFKLIEDIKQGMHKESILIISVPNDFSSLQNYLLEKKQTSKRWIFYPDHLNYFNNESLTAFLNDLGFEIVSKITTFPIEMFLLNDVLNYDKDKSKGSMVYSIVRDFDLYLSTIGIDKALKLYESFCDIGLGRNLTYYCKLR